MLSGTLLGDNLDIMKLRVSFTMDKLPSIDSEYENSKEFKELIENHKKRTLEVIEWYNKPYFDDMSKTSRRYMEFLMFKFEVNIKMFGAMRNFNYIYKDNTTKDMMFNLIAECSALKILLEEFIDIVTEDNYIDNKKSKYEDIIIGVVNSI